MTRSASSWGKDVWRRKGRKRRRAGRYGGMRMMSRRRGIDEEAMKLYGMKGWRWMKGCDEEEVAEERKQREQQRDGGGCVGRTKYGPQLFPQHHLAAAIAPAPVINATPSRPLVHPPPFFLTSHPSPCPHPSRRTIQLSSPRVRGPAKMTQIAPSPTLSSPTEALS